MTMHKAYRTIAALTTVGALTSTLSFAQSKAEDSRRLEEIARNAAQEFAAARASEKTGKEEQTRSTTPPSPAGTVVELTLDDSTQRALERNLDIAVERLNPQTYDFALAALDANYKPTLTSNFSTRSQTAFARSQTAGGDVLVTDTITNNYGLTQNMRWGGGSFAVAFNNNRQAQSDAFAIRNPALNTNLSAAFAQPLLRNFRIDGTRTQLQVTKINQQISETTLRATITRTVANVRNAYWDLVYAIQAADVAERSLQLANRLVEDNQARVEVGTLAPLDVVQAQAEQATRRQTVTQTIAARRTAELALKRLIVNGTDDPLWSVTLEPIDRPTYSSTPIDVAAAVRKALGSRTDLETAHKQLQANDINLKSLTDTQLPALDLTASYGLAGIGGPQFVRQGLGGTITDVIPGGFSNALGLIKDFRAPTWNVGLSLSYPIGTSPAEANVARARLQQRQTLAQSRALELQIATEVTNAALQVEANQERLQASNVALELAEKRLEAEQSRFDVGLSTNFFVVSAQRDLRDAQNAQLRALLDYRRAQVDFERVQEIPAAGGGGITTIQGGAGQAPRANTGGGGGFN
jgi:outer membrane protein TolC